MRAWPGPGNTGRSCSSVRRRSFCTTPRRGSEILCSNVFLSGLDPEFAAANTGFFSSPPELRGAVTDTVVDYENRRVHLTLPDGTVRSAKQHGRGCLALPIGESEPYYEAVDATPDLPDAETTPWPMGDLLPDEAFPEDVDMDKVAQAVDAAFDPPEGLTAAFVVTHRAGLLGERTARGSTPHATRELVDGQEPDGHPLGITDSQRACTTLAVRAHSRVARSRAIRARRFGSATS